MTNYNPLPIPSNMIPKSVTNGDVINICATINNNDYIMCLYEDDQLFDTYRIISVVMAPISLGDCLKPLSVTITTNASIPNIISRQPSTTNTNVFFYTYYRSNNNLTCGSLNSFYDEASQTTSLALWESCNPGSNSQFMINNTGTETSSTINYYPQTYTIMSSTSNNLSYEQIADTPYYKILTNQTTNTINFSFIYRADDSVQKLECCLGSSSYPQSYCDKYSPTNETSSNNCQVAISDYCSINQWDTNCVCNLSSTNYEGLNNYPPECVYSPCVNSNSAYLTANQKMMKTNVCNDLVCNIDLATLTNKNAITSSSQSKCNTKSNSKTFSTTSIILLIVLVMIIFLLIALVSYLIYKSHKKIVIS